MAATVDLVRQHIGRGDAAAEAGLLERFVTALFDKAEEGFAAQFDGADLYAMAVDGLEFLRELAGVFKVEVLNPTRAANGWESPFTVVRLVMTDRPFIVDSVQAEVARQGLELAYQLHPILDVVRDERGRLVDVDGDAGGRPEAFEMFFVERVEGAALRRLRNRVKAVLHDVYRATRDYLPMQERSREAVDYLLVLARSGVQPAAGIKADEVGSDLEDELEEYAEFIRWLLDENFVYLGYREYELKDVGGEPHLQVRRGKRGRISHPPVGRRRQPLQGAGGRLRVAEAAPPAGGRRPAARRDEDELGGHRPPRQAHGLRGRQGAGRRRRGRRRAALPGPVHQQGAEHARRRDTHTPAQAAAGPRARRGGPGQPRLQGHRVGVQLACGPTP